MNTKIEKGYNKPEIIPNNYCHHGSSREGTHLISAHTSSVHDYRDLGNYVNTPLSIYQ